MKPFEEAMRYDYPLTPESLVVNCGGYDGAFAREIHRRYGCLVWSFEPIFHVKLTETLSDLYPKVRVWPVGLAGKSEPRTMRIKGSMSGAFVDDGEQAQVSVRDVIEALTRPVSLLELNCEGAEFEILERILDWGNPTHFANIQVQPHPVVINCENRWQSQGGAALPVGEARPGWKILRVLGNLLNLPGFEYQTSEEVLAEVRARCAEVKPTGYQGTHAVVPTSAGEEGAGLVDVPLYQSDALVRRAPSLQRTREGRTPAMTY